MLANYLLTKQAATAGNVAAFMLSAFGAGMIAGNKFPQHTLNPQWTKRRPLIPAIPHQEDKKKRGPR